MTRSGITLIEVLLVVALLFVVFSMSAIFYSNYYGYSAASVTMQQLAFELQKAQMYSVMGRQGSGWGVTYASGSIVLYAGASYAARNTNFVESYAVASSVLITGMNETDFARRTGFPNITSTVSITDSGRTRTLIVQPQGTISYK